VSWCFTTPATAGRNLFLKVMGKPRINNLDIPGNDRF